MDKTYVVTDKNDVVTPPYIKRLSEQVFERLTAFMTASERTNERNAERFDMAVERLDMAAGRLSIAASQQRPLTLSRSRSSELERHGRSSLGTRSSSGVSSSACESSESPSLPGDRQRFRSVSTQVEEYKRETQDHLEPEARDWDKQSIAIMRAKLQVKLLTAQQEKVMARAAAEVEQVNARAAEQARAFALYVARASAHPQPSAASDISAPAKGKHFTFSSPLYLWGLWGFIEA